MNAEEGSGATHPGPSHRRIFSQGINLPREENL